MNNLALSLPQTEPAALELAAAAAPAQTSAPCTPVTLSEVAWVGIVMCLLQVLDGTLTAVGVHHQGIAAEGNLIIRALMEAWGPVFALVAIKLLAIAIVCVLCVLAFRVPWITRALRIIAVIYIGAAIIPWTAILVTRVL